jgi:hypothetical protein
MTVSFALISAGYALGLTQVSPPPSDGPTIAHLSTGTIVVALATLNILLGIFRPSQASPRRKYFNWIHGWSGRLAVVLAFVTVFLGLVLIDAGAAWYAIIGVACGLWALLFVVFSVLLRSRYPLVDSRVPAADGPAEEGNVGTKVR